MQESESFWPWIADCVAHASAPNRTSSLLLTKEEERALYAQLLVRRCRGRMQLDPAFQTWEESYREELRASLAAGGHWDHTNQRLEHALSSGYGGMANLPGIMRFGMDYVQNLRTGQDRLLDCNRLMFRLGLRADWAGAVLLAAHVRRLWRERMLATLSGNVELDPWPGGVQETDRAPAPCVPLAWDPGAESKQVALDRLASTAKAYFSDVEETARSSGARPVKTTLVDRNVEATYLRLWGWSWSRLERYFAERSTYPATRSALRKAVDDVLSLLGIARPNTPPGRPLRQTS